MIMSHSNYHNHKKPLISIPEHYSKEKFKAVVVNNPNSKPLKLGVGLHMKETDETDRNKAVRFLSEAYNNSSRVAYYRRAILKELGYVMEGGTTLDSIAQLQLTFADENVNVSSSTNIKDFHMSVRTEYMKERLIDNSDYGRVILGVMTDITYSYFTDGYLISSVCYDNMQKRWTPVLWTWIRKIDERHIIPHFVVLIQTILSAFEDESQQDELIGQVPEKLIYRLWTSPKPKEMLSSRHTS